MSAPKKKRAPAGAVQQAAATTIGLTPLVVLAAAALGHPISPEYVPYIAGALAGIGGYFHPDGKK